MARIRDDYVFGTLAAEIGTGDTILTSTGLERLSAVTAPDVAAVILYSGDDYEIVHVTAHAALSATATVLRGQEGTVAQAWGTGATWRHGPTEDDFSTPAAGPEAIGVALSDETTTIATGTAKATIRMPFAMTLTGVRATLSTASSSGVVTVDINEGGTSVLSTKLTVDATEKTSTTATAAAVISDGALADDAEITFDIDTAGTGATGLKVWLIGTRA